MKDESKHKYKTVGFWARTKLQALECFTEEYRDKGLSLSDEQWWQKFVEWLEEPATQEFDQ